MVTRCNCTGTESLSTLLFRQPEPNEIFREEDTSRHTHLRTGSLSFIEERSNPMGQRKETRGSSPLAKHKGANYSRMMVHFEEIRLLVSVPRKLCGLELR